MYKDKTLQDNNRTDLNLQRSEIQKVLPDFYSEDYPQLITLFEKYYDWLNDSDNPGGQIKNLYLSRDATQVPERLLPFLEDELLLGQAYFGGFINKREAIKRSNLLYRSKGTKYSIEQFFRAFYGIDPQVIYPKENIFKVGPQIDYEQDVINTAGQQVKEEASRIGPESRKFITDDKLYQVLSVLIRAELSITEWQEVYKLFVHPAGVYLGAEIVIEAINKSHDGIVHTPGLYNNGGINIIQDDEGTPIPEFLAAGGLAEFNISATVSTTLISLGDNDTPLFRQDVNTLFNNIGPNVTTEDFGEYTDYRELLSPNSVRFDDSDGILMSQDSDGNRTAIIIERFDTHKISTQFDSA